jgi:hypothetical protein
MQDDFERLKTQKKKRSSGIQSNLGQVEILWMSQKKNWNSACKAPQQQVVSVSTS